MGGFDLAARYRGGFIGIWAEGTIAWWCTRHANGIIVRGWRLIVRRTLVRRQVYDRIMVVVMTIRLESVGWWGRGWIV
jgi:hypothetical protein